MAATLKGLQGRHINPVTKKKPLTIEMLQAIAGEAANTKSWSDLCLVMAYLLAYSAFLRFSELRRIRPVDITFHEG